MAKQSKSRRNAAVMSMPECANYLHLSETTVLKLATDGNLPGTLVDKKWQFQRDQVDEWLAQKLNMTQDAGLDEIPDGMHVPLGDLLPEEAVIGDLQATDALAAIEELAARAYNQNWLNDKPWFVGALIERELLASTAMEGGVAFLHTRAREGDRIARPFIVAGRSYNGVAFGAPDGKPTFLFFLLGLKYDRLHLPVLGRLARSVRHPATIGKLRAQPSATKIRALLLEEDARSLNATAPARVPYEALKPKLDRQIRLRTIMRLNAQRKREAEKEAKKKKTTSSRSSKTGKTATGTKASAAATKKTSTKKTTATSAKKATATSKAAASKKSASKATSKKTVSKKTPRSKKTSAKKSSSRG